MDVNDLPFELNKKPSVPRMLLVPAHLHPGCPGLDPRMNRENLSVEKDEIERLYELNTHRPVDS